MIDIKKVKKIVIKIGSSSISDKNGIRRSFVENLAKEIALIKKHGVSVLIVSSGAIAVGKKFIKYRSKLGMLEEKRAAAAIGQTLLIKAYQEIFAEAGIKSAQALFGLEDSDNRTRYLNARSTINSLIENDIVPIINENDVVAVEEARMGDNDRLAARVGQMIGADLTILLTDIDGLYDDNPKINKDAKFIPVISEIDDAIDAMAKDTISDVGTGGMITKIRAAKIAVSSGCGAIVASSEIEKPLSNIFFEKNGRYTLFKPKSDCLTARKSWIGSQLHPDKGEVVVDDGAKEAITSGKKSLLPAGITAVKGDFSRGEAVFVVDQKGQKIAIGLVSYDAYNAKKIIGYNSKEINEILGFVEAEELIHRDDLVIL